MGFSLSAPTQTLAASWSTNAPMTNARFTHTATLLPNGKLLVAGGWNGTNRLASAELLDPATGQWTNTGSLNLARRYHTATLLRNGKVLVAGGEGTAFPGYLNSTELFDPVTGQWATTGPLSIARESHTATLLADGRVLVAGGIGTNSLSLASAELFDPSTETWTKITNSMIAARSYHTATLLPDGKVLLAAGHTSVSPVSLSSAELFDPADESWTPMNSLNGARYSHTATLLPDGKVLVAGGITSVSLATVELFNPATGTWTVTNSLASPRHSHSATLLPNGQVLVAGGFSSSLANLASAELYNPATGTWTATTNSLTTSRYLHTATMLANGKVVVAGGFKSGSEYLSSVEVFDSDNGKWVRTGDVLSVRGGHTATMLPSGKVLVVDGYRHSSLLYDPTSGNWIGNRGNSDIVQKVLERWKKLVASDDKEPHYQKFLSDHAGLFFGLNGASLVVSQLQLGTARRPDFVIARDFRSAGVMFELIELKRPCHPPFTRGGSPSQHLLKALEQVRKWKARLEENCTEVRERLPASHAADRRCSFTIIIGRRDNANEWLSERNYFSKTHKVAVRSYDYLTDELANREFKHSSGPWLSGDELTLNQLANPFAKAFTDKSWRAMLQRLSQSSPERLAAFQLHFLTSYGVKVVEFFKLNELFDEFVERQAVAPSSAAEHH